MTLSTDPDAHQPDASHPPRIRPDWPRSYLRRQGHVTRAQKRALRELWERYGLDAPHGRVLDLDEAFGRAGSKRALDIGFGMGDTLLARALAEPALDILGVEVHRPGLGAALIKIDEEQITNVRVVRHDVFQLLSEHVPERSFHEVSLFFPEPWPKDRDHKRRIVRPLLLELLERVCHPGAQLVLATDVEDYAHGMRELLEASPRWQNNHAEQPFAPRCAWRPVTIYEQKGIDEGRGIFDLSYTLST